MRIWTRRRLIYALATVLFLLPQHVLSAELLRPRWEIRYVLFVGRSNLMEVGLRTSKDWNARRGPDAPLYRDRDELFAPETVFKTNILDSLSKIYIRFDRSGKVLTTNLHGSELFGERNHLDYVVLIEPKSTDPRPFHLADWSQGVPGDTTFSPAVCGYYDERRYDWDWTGDLPAGNFGCREWTAQMRERERPYIDVTTYRRGHNFIGEFVGWATFEDPPIPVIGMQGKTWLCLHDCPDGESPGVIHNFKAWLKKHRYPMPQRPRKQPLYPNADYWDDIHEMDED